MSSTTHILLTEQQQQALDTIAPPTPDRPPDQHRLRLVPKADYEAVREALEDDRRQRAIRRVALRNAAGRLAEAP